MARTPSGALLALLDPAAAEPLHRQLHGRIREAILAGALAPGARLPSTRTLARDVGVSRNTVELAFSQLDAEGFLVRRVGSGSVVAVPAHALGAQRLAPVPSRTATRGALRLSRAAARLLAAPPRPEPLEVRPLTPCLPALREFPLRAWRRSVSRAWRDGGEGVLGYAPVEGLPSLRRAVQQHLAGARGVRCDWRQVLVFTSTQQALDAAARVLLEPGDAAWTEEPGYAGARAALEAAGARAVPVPVDEEGLDVAAGEARAGRARLAYVTPSHQYPLGVTLSPARRRALLAWAARADAYVLEDDYDSEFRYGSRPVACIQSIDEGGRVLYAGTFNKVMFPALRLAFLVVPAPLVDAFAALRAAADGHVAHPTQAAMADFIAAGQLGAHVRRMRALYEERRDALRDALAREAAGLLEPGPADAGMHLTARLAAGGGDVAAAARAWQRGLDPRALSPMFATAARVQGLVLGFSGAEPAALRRAARELARAVAEGPGAGRAGTRRA